MGSLRTLQFFSHASASGIAHRSASSQFILVGLYHRSASLVKPRSHTSGTKRQGSCPGMSLTVDILEFLIQQPGIDLGGGDICMAQHLLNGTQVRPVL